MRHTLIGDERRGGRGRFHGRRRWHLQRHGNHGHGHDKCDQQGFLGQAAQLYLKVVRREAEHANAFAVVDVHHA